MLGVPDSELFALGRTAAQLRLQDFADLAGPHYAKNRNFVAGRRHSDNVSKLSPYVRHRLLLETEILDVVLSRHSSTAAAKFIEEVFWRAYFKGYLEQRPTIWHDYRASVARLTESLTTDSALEDRYSKAVQGQTGIECYDSWVRELRETGYLHNHARMWFASIWIYTLKLPWQLGADFFYRHLLDGDPASNTLSWRWVCGLHTKGKTYLARASNIAKYTGEQFDPSGQLATVAAPIVESVTHAMRRIPEGGSLPDRGAFALLITEEDCFPESLLGNRAPVAVGAIGATELRSSLPVSATVKKFAASALDDALARAGDRYGVQTTSLDDSDWLQSLERFAVENRVNTIVTLYAPTGPVAEQLKGVDTRLKERGIELIGLQRDFDRLSWPHATKGYFKLKQKIPQLLDALGYSLADDDRQAARG